jgi:hypothetical protein
VVHHPTVERTSSVVKDMENSLIDKAITAWLTNMINTVTDERLPIEKRKALLLKKISRDLRKWEHDISSGSLRKLRKLRRLMRELGVDETPWRGTMNQLKNEFIVEEVMKS